MSVSEWTEGLKKKEATLGYVNPSVGSADSSPAGEPLGTTIKPAPFAGGFQAKRDGGSLTFSFYNGSRNTARRRRGCIRG